jgi:hypothetical protein
MLKLLKNIICFLILFLFCGCFQNFGKKHSHFDLGVSICLPEDWTRITLDPRSDLTSMAFESEKKSFLLVSLMPKDKPVSQIKQEMASIFVILDSGPLLFTKYKTDWMLHVDDTRTTIRYILKDHKGQIFTIVGSSETLYFESFRPIFNKIVRSFRAY